MNILKLITKSSSLSTRLTIKQYKSIKGKTLKNHFYVAETNLHESELKLLVNDIKKSGKSFEDDAFQIVESFVYKGNVYGSIDDENWYMLGTLDKEHVREVNSLLMTSRIDKLSIKYSGDHAYNKVGYNVYLNFYGSKDAGKKD